MNIRRFFKWFASAWLVLWCLMTTRGEATTAAGMNRMKQLVRSRFPGVKQLPPAELAAWLTDTNRVPPLLLDVRQADEFAVSHLPGARRVEPQISACDLLPTLPTNRPVVVYCSVGYRSSELAARLLRAGHTNVMNLEGSVFQWANEGRPLEGDGKPAARVHPYNATFGKLLKPGLCAKSTGGAR